MALSGDMPTETSQHESFSLANMIPQDPKNNQILWQGIEEATRTLASRDGEVYVVTGPIFEGSSLERLNGRVLVPAFVFKAIYDPVRKDGRRVCDAECTRHGVSDAVHRRPGKTDRHQCISEAAGADQRSENGTAETHPAWVEARKEYAGRSRLINEVETYPPSNHFRTKPTRS